MLEIKVNLEKKCKQCGKAGACENGYCLACIAKEIEKGKFDHIIKPLRDATKTKIDGIIEGAVKSTQGKPK